MKKLASLSVTFTFGMAVLSMPTLALAQATLVEFESPGELTDAGVVVPVTVACSPDYVTADLEVNLRQPNVNPVALGQGDLALDGFPEKCPTTPQIVHVLVPSSRQPFEVGSAAGQASLGACFSGGRNCNVPKDFETIDIVE